ncbi:MAG TPA: very short patch repair endonuclease [Nitrosospira sp.]|nr:very short patch repair endonuclease [Nitrosospira sp.]
MDTVSKEKRSEIMRAIRSANTTPEIKVRRLLRSLGYTGYRLHRADIPGKPDIAFVKKRKAIIVNGCFWHGHDCKVGRRVPKSNQDYWVPKIRRNRERDVRHIADLEELNWNVLIIWECEIKALDQLTAKLNSFLDRFI